eukprot:m.8936 g.8936  ORF g.8936 m.8936 type:complete len:400 (-) comp3369_c0_seq2:86-1285(-)
MKKRLMAQAREAREAAARAEQGDSARDARQRAEPTDVPAQDPAWQAMLAVAPAHVDAGEDHGDEGGGLHLNDTLSDASVAGAGDASAQRRYKWQTSLDVQFSFDFANARPHPDLAAINWNGVRGLQRSDAGAEGVFFADTVEGAFVVKGSRSVAAEVFSTLMAAQLGIVTPATRIVRTASSEGKRMLEKCKELDASGRASVNLGSQTHVLLKPFQRGKNLSQAGVKYATEFFQKPGQLEALGAVLVLDVLCNNGDRLPLIWENRGNPGNVMICNQRQQVVSVDSQLLPIADDHAQQRQEYMDKVSGLISRLRADPVAEAPEFAAVRTKLREFTGYDCGIAGCEAMQAGFLKTADTCGGVLSVERLEGWRDALRSHRPPLVGLDALNVEFVASVIATLEQ